MEQQNDEMFKDGWLARWTLVTLVNMDWSLRAL